MKYRSINLLVLAAVLAATAPATLAQEQAARLFVEEGVPSTGFNRADGLPIWRFLHGGA